MSVIILRMIAILTMTIDHIGSSFLGNAAIWRGLGRAAFPLFCFLLAEGFWSARLDFRKQMKHLCMLAVLAVLSEFPYDLRKCGFGYAGYMEEQSVMLTLFLGYLAMMCIRNICSLSGKLLYGTLIALYFGLGAQMLHTDYGLWGVMLIASFHFARLLAESSGGDVSFFAPLIYYVMIVLRMAMNGTLRTALVEYRPTVMFLGYLLVIPVLCMYDGKRGYRSTAVSVISKTYYPLHLLIIGTILVFA